ncbi:MAG: hypothetical protein MJE66_14920 [Proteobacteria bacterium]|nr:hypothetical protein [Pseudomonadota bacterium]
MGAALAGVVVGGLAVTAFAPGGALQFAPGLWAQATLRAAQAWPERGSLPQIVLDLKFKHLHTLHGEREAALARGELLQESGTFVPAQVRRRGADARVALRLAPGRIDGLAGAKWPLELWLRGGERVLGLRGLVLRDALEPGAVESALFGWHARREGLLAPRATLVRVFLNGRDLGLMLAQELAAPELLLHNQRRPGALLGFDDGFLDAIRAPDRRAALGRPDLATLRSLAGPRDKPTTTPADLGAATGLVRAVMERLVPAHDAFDAEAFGRYLALAAFWDSPRAAGWRSVRFYYNPATARLEPLVPDLGARRDCAGMDPCETWAARLLEDPEIAARFAFHVARLETEAATGDLLAEIEAALQSDWDSLALEDPFAEPFDLDALRARAVNLSEHVRAARALRAESGTWPLRSVRALSWREGRRQWLELWNPFPTPLEVVGVRHAHADGREAELAALADGSEWPRQVPAASGTGSPRRWRVALERSRARPAPDRLRAELRVGAGDDPITVEAQPTVAARTRPVLAAPTVAQTLAQHAFLRRAEDGVLEIGAGRHAVPGWLSLPPGEPLRIRAGAVLRFAAGGGLVVRDRLLLEGTEREPVVLEGPAAPRNRDRWAGVVVFDGDGSHWRHAVVRYPRGIELDGWRLGAGVTFYGGQAALEDCVFEGDSSEQALSFVSNEFRARGLRVRDVRGDALDADFSTGTLADLQIERVGRDGLDLSGSTVEAEAVRMADIGDEAISLGEGSRLSATDLNIERVDIGVTSKDGSNAELRDLSLRAVGRVGFLAYRDRHEYPPPAIAARRVLVDESPRRALAAVGCRIEIDGERAPEQEIDVESLSRAGTRRS